MTSSLAGLGLGQQARQHVPLELLAGGAAERGEILEGDRRRDAAEHGIGERGGAGKGGGQAHHERHHRSTARQAVGHCLRNPLIYPFKAYGNDRDARRRWKPQASQ